MITRESLLLLILLVSFPSLSPEVRASGCTIRFTSVNPSNLPQGVIPGEFTVNFWFDLTSSDMDNTKLSVSVSGTDINLLSKSIIKSSRSGSVRVSILDRPGEYASFTITISCQVDGYSNSDTKSMGRAYIVSIPYSWTPSVTPSTVDKRDTVTLEVSGLSVVDDGVGSLTVSAKLGSKTYYLDKVGNGEFRKQVTLNFVDRPAGSKTVTFMVYKSYGGASDVDHKTSTLVVRGSPPQVLADIPAEIHRGDSITITVEEPDGDTVNGTLTAFGESYELSKGGNTLTVPRDVRAGSYTVSASVRDVDGTNSGEWSFTVVNVPPTVRVNVDREKASPGQELRIDVLASDDAIGLQATLTIDGDDVHEEYSLEGGEGSVSYRIPIDFSGELVIRAVVTDIDSEQAVDEATVHVGSLPSLSGEIPPTVHRGDEYSIEVRGDDPSGSVSLMGRTIPINGPGTYTITIPSDVREGRYEIHAYVENEFGSESQTWSVFLENLPPQVEVSSSKSQAEPGDTIVISVAASDDSPGLQVVLEVNGETYSLGSGGSLSYTVPQEISQVVIEAAAIDWDGARASDSLTIPVISVGSSPGDDAQSGSQSDRNSSDTSVASRESNSSELVQREAEVGQSPLNEGSNDTSAVSLESNASELVQREVLEDKSAMPPESVVGEEGSFTVTVVPSNPYEGQNVTITAIPSEGARGRVWVINPSSEIVLDFPVVRKREVTLKVDVVGLWLVKWAYKIGRESTKFGQLKFNVSEVPKVMEFSSPELVKGRAPTQTTQQFREPKGRIDRFSARCMTYIRKESRKSPDLLLVLVAVTLLAYLVIRRRVS